jgi:hypothetical protein
MSEKQRKCLKCGKMFHSSCSANRICRRCKKQNRHMYGGLEAPAIDEVLVRRFTYDSTLPDGQGKYTKVQFPKKK